MAWFEYGIPERRSLRKNVALRVRDFTITNDIKILMREGERLELILIKEILPNNNVLLEFHSRNYLIDPHNRHTVFYLVYKEDPGWICESDIGRGYK